VCKFQLLTRCSCDTPPPPAEDTAVCVQTLGAQLLLTQQPCVHCCEVHTRCMLWSTRLQLWSDAGVYCSVHQAGLHRPRLELLLHMRPREPSWPSTDACINLKHQILADHCLIALEVPICWVVLLLIPAPPSTFVPLNRMCSRK
jgi:hypothetical protein